MITPEQLDSLKEFLQTARTAMVILGPKPTDDQLAVASALHQALSALGKSSGVYAPNAVDDARFAGLAQVGTDLGKQNLVIELEYDENTIDSVKSHIGEESGKLYLTVKPKKGYPPLKTSQIGFSYAGADADLVFLIGVHDLEMLDQLYFGYESLYENAFVVTLHSFQPDIGNVQLDLSGVSSLSEAVADIFERMGIGVTAEMATDLLRGIEAATQNLRSLAATADTFEIVAGLLRAGGRRVKPAAERAEDQARQKAVVRPEEREIAIKGKKPSKNRKTTVQQRPTKKKSTIQKRSTKQVTKTKPSATQTGRKRK